MNLSPQRLHGDSFKKYKLRRARNNEMVAARLKHGVVSICKHEVVPLEKKSVLDKQLYKILPHVCTTILNKKLEIEHVCTPTKK